jgi:lipoprotein-anchoring transpeptidase ErfK/SrfK
MNVRSLFRLSFLFAGTLLLTVPRGSAQAPAEPPRPEDTPAQPAEETTEPAAPDTTEAAPAAPAQPAGRPVSGWLEAQVQLSREGFSCGSIDGVRGLQTATTLKAWQKNQGLKETGELDKPTLGLLLIRAPALTEYTFTVVDLAVPRPVPTTWLEKSQVDSMRYGSALEMIAERFRANPKLITKLNPAVKWEQILPGTVLTVPSAEPDFGTAKVSRIHVYLAEHILQAVDETGRVILHCPVSIARNVEKRPVGELHVSVVAPDPNYTFDPVTFPEVPEAQELGRKLIIPPGPNNPVGLAWIGLDRTGYGIHGTPDPEKVGRTESHGCFRLANWDARTLLKFVWVGMPVMVEE